MYNFGTFQQCTLIFIVSLFYIIQAPFTKVEESFSIQAIHDYIYHSDYRTVWGSFMNLFQNINSENDQEVSSGHVQWDHERFPGVVHRTFIPSFIIGSLAKIFQQLHLFESRLSLQILSRIILHLFFLYSYSRFIRSVSTVHGKEISKWITLLFVSQFHFIFYSSRTLPNTFALIFVLHAYSDWIVGNWYRLIPNIAFTVIILRFETIILFGCILLVELYAKRISLLTILKIGIPAGILSLICTVLFDSIVWGKWLWPEGDGILFNIIANKSHEFGTSPFLWYFYSVIPRLALFSLGFQILAPNLLNKYIFVTLLFVGLYSILPHKELRFVIYISPLINITLAQSITKLWKLFETKSKVDDDEDGKEKSATNWLDLLMKCLIVSTLLGNILLTALFFRMSSQNYPGGVALRTVNDFIRADLTKSHQISVYVSNLAAQTGFTRFLEVDNIYYNKEPVFQKKDFHNFQVIYFVLEIGDEKKYFDRCQSKVLCDLIIGNHKHSCNWIQNVSAFDWFDIRRLAIHYRTFLNIYRCSVQDS